MENVYASYTKRIQATTFFFVKKFVVFPDLKDVPPMLEGYGMHTDFDQACTIAGVKDSEIKKQLLNEIECGTPQAKIIELNDAGFLSQKVAGL